MRDLRREMNDRSSIKNKNNNNHQQQLPKKKKTLYNQVIIKMKMMSKSRELTEVLTEVRIFLSDPQDQAMPKLCHRPRRFHLIRRSKTLLIRVDLHTTHHLIRLRVPSPIDDFTFGENSFDFWRSERELYSTVMDGFRAIEGVSDQIYQT